MSSDVYMLVHVVHERNQSLWTFLRPFYVEIMDYNSWCVHLYWSCSSIIWSILLETQRPRNYLLWVRVRCSTIFSRVQLRFLLKIYTKFFSRVTAAHPGQRVTPPPILKRIIMVVWFPISTFFFHEGTLKCFKMSPFIDHFIVILVINIFLNIIFSYPFCLF
ncbi:hypothetical protein Hanom_Chr03g00195921 [Helianthus anomalus]